MYLFKSIKEENDRWMYKDAALLSVIVANYSPICWKKRSISKDADMQGIFVVGINTPRGEATFYFSERYWDMFRCKEAETVSKWNIQAPMMSIERIASLIQ